MKALTIRQPYASLVAAGVKRIETRSWRTSYRGRIAIHAGAHRPTEGEEYGTGWWWTWDSFGPGIIVEQDPRPSGWREFPAPLGAIVATAELVDCVPIVDSRRFDWPHTTLLAVGDTVIRLWHPSTEVAGWGAGTEMTDQRPYGDYTPGRWAWMLDDIKPVNERCPFCWGARFACPQHGRLATCLHETVPTCHVCEGRGSCDPVPARGRQGLWNWEPA